MCSIETEPTPHTRRTHAARTHAPQVVRHTLKIDIIRLARSDVLQVGRRRVETFPNNSGTADEVEERVMQRHGRQFLILECLFRTHVQLVQRDVLIFFHFVHRRVLQHVEKFGDGGAAATSAMVQGELKVLVRRREPSVRRRRRISVGWFTWRVGAQAARALLQRDFARRIVTAA